MVLDYRSLRTMTTSLSRTSEQDPVDTRLRSSRVDLLDLSLRNPLLNYRPSMRRGLEVTDEKATQIFSYLVVEAGALRIHHTKTSAAPAQDPNVFFLEGESPGAAHVGVGESNAANSLATPYTKDVLARRLLATASDAWLTLQEHGVNTLFLALGMLQWTEDDSAELHLAPLVLIPVRLDRKSAHAQWQLSATDEDPGLNLSLAEKLREFGIRVPPSPALETVADLEALFAAVEAAVAAKSGWSVARDRMAVGFFSFGKFLMYKDLDPDAWPVGGKPGEHALLRSILQDGFRDRASDGSAEVNLDDTRPPGRVMEILDVDGSQAEALAEVAAGRSLIIQGPPGTGKSQTISNLIAEAVSSGKRVLFVAEKLAALEVVKRRLESAGVGDLCLELHSHKASKKEVAADLARTLALGRPLEAKGSEDELAKYRGALNKSTQAGWTPVGTSGLSPYQAIGILERLGTRPHPVPRVRCPVMESWSKSDFESARSALEDLAAKMSEIGVPARHPFSGSGLTDLLPADREKIEAALGLAPETLERLRSSAASLAEALGLAPVTSLERAQDALALAACALKAPNLRGIPPLGPAWDDPEALRALQAAGESALKRRAIISQSRLRPDAWDEDLRPARADLMADGGSWWRRFLSGRYKAAKRQIQSLCSPPVPASPLDLISLSGQVIEVRRLKEEVLGRLAAVRPLLGERAGGVDSDWEELLGIKAWATGFRALVRERKSPAALLTWVVSDWDPKKLQESLAAMSRATSDWQEVSSRIMTGLALTRDGPGDLRLLSFADALEKVQSWLKHLDQLASYVSYRRLYQGVGKRGLEPVIHLGHEGAADPSLLSLVLEQAWARLVLDRAMGEREELRGFDAVTHEQLIQRFRSADEGSLRVNRARLAAAHWSSLPGPAAYGQVGILRRECAKKSRHLPIRRLMEQAGAAVQAAKPVFLMSPLSVAAFLPAGTLSFDLVVFDEASQVRPVDALGSIVRGRQLVVVGDEKQLPPTSFFDTMVTTEGVTDGEEDGPGTNVTQDMQSILGLCAAQGMPSRMLRWHYRSRHESLIALSNREFYDDQLEIFPGPQRDQEGEGLLLRHLPDTVYERGASRTNPREADQVAQAVLEHSRSAPDLTLGVVAFGQPQREAIEQRIEALVRKHADFDAWVRSHREEPFFVKNLENVQGDERDVMLISVGYGRDARGAVSMNLGPLNQAGGERRLNVLITRARRKCLVYTNLRADDLDLKRAGGAGVRAFKAFLEFAQSGRLATRDRGTPGFDSEFEAQVEEALRRAGYAVEAQIGSGTYRIDLVVVDPSSRGRYLLGIECDGERYHAARWARDRDRLREAVLRGLGWKLHRVWSADWHLHREESLRRCVAAIEASRLPDPPEAPRPPAPQAVQREAEGRQLWQAPLYAPAKVSAELGQTHLAEVPTETVAQFVTLIVEEEGPVHVEEVKRRVLEAIGARAGSKRESAIEEAIGAAVGERRVRRRGEFLLSVEDRRVGPRDRSGLPDASRRLDYVCDQECLEALGQVSQEACGCDADEAANQAIRLLGVKRNDEALARLKALLNGP